MGGSPRGSTTWQPAPARPALSETSLQPVACATESGFSSWQPRMNGLRPVSLQVQLIRAHPRMRARGMRTGEGAQLHASCLSSFTPATNPAPPCYTHLCPHAPLSCRLGLPSAKTVAQHGQEQPQGSPAQRPPPGRLHGSPSGGAPHPTAPGPGWPGQSLEEELTVPTGAHCPAVPASSVQHPGLSH